MGNIVWFFVSFPFFLVVPGLLLSFLLFKKSEVDVWERIAYSLGLSMLVALVFGLLLSNLQQLSALGYLVCYLVFFIGFFPLFVWKNNIFEKNSFSDGDVNEYLQRHKNKYSKKELVQALIEQKVPLSQIEKGMHDKEPKYMKYLIPSLVILVIVLTGFVVFYPHYNYAYPLHADEWRIARDSLKTLDYKSLYVEEASSGFKDYTETEPGVYLFTSMLYSLCGLDWQTTFQFLPAIVMMISSFILFVFVKKMTKSQWAGIFAMLFFASLKSNVNVMGPWFFNALTLNIPLLFLFFYCLYRAVISDSIKLFIISFLFLFGVVVVYPYAGAYAFVVAVVYLFVNFQFLRKHSLFVLAGTGIPFLAFIFTFSVLKKGTIFDTIAYLWTRAHFPIVYSSFEPQYKIAFFFGVIAFGLAILGVIVALKKYRLIAIWTIFLGLFFYYNQNIRWDTGSIFIHYLRLVVFFDIALVIPAAIGLGFIVSMIMKIDLKFKYGKVLLGAFAAALSLFVFAYTFYDYTAVPSHLDVYHFIESDDINLIKGIDGSFVVTYSINSRPIKLITEQPFGFYKPDGTLSENCDKFMEDISANKYRYVLSDQTFDCGPWFELYKSENGKYLYKVIAEI